MSRTARFINANVRQPLAVLDPIDMLRLRADACTRAEDAAFWILTSAAAHLNGYNLNDGEGSSVEAWERKRAERAA